MKVNSQYFDKEQIEAGQMQKLLDFLMSEAYSENSNYYNDIRIKPEDMGAFVVEWAQVPWTGDFGGYFQYIDEDQIVMLNKVFPDGHYEQCIDEEDYQERLTKWLKENPGWVRTSYGLWTNEIENEKFRKEINEAQERAIHLENGIPQGE